MDLSKENSLLLSTHELRIGMYVHIELGWMDHPFALNKFRIANDKQLQDIQSLQLKQIRVFPSKSDEGLFNSSLLDALSITSQPQEIDHSNQDNGLILALQRASLARCDKSFSEASAQWQKVMANVDANPLEARITCNSMMKAFVHETAHEQDTHIRLLSEIAGESFVLHALNVTVISILLARYLGLTESEIEDVGMAALLHDVGKQKLPERVKLGLNLSPAQEILARSHVSQSVDICRAMGLGAGVLNIISQHHEFADGSGYPNGLTAGQMTRGAQIVSLVNIYDNLSNPNNSMLSLTPHEAMSMLFAQRKHQFEHHTLQAFVKLMGVYPPGSVVQLNDDRYAVVVSANASRPNKPAVLVHDSAVPADQALVLNLDSSPDVSIRRSLHAKHLPPTSLDYLSPRKRICYFFERSYGSDNVHGAIA